MSFTNQHINYIERAFLNGQATIDPRQCQWVPIVSESLNLIQVFNIPRVDEGSEDKSNQYQASVVERMVDSLSGVHDLGYSTVYAIVGQKTKVSLFMATGLHSGAAINQKTGQKINDGVLSSLLNSAYPGIEVDAVSDESTTLINLFDGLNYGAMITGTPTLKVQRKHGADLQIDRLIRSLYRTNWAYLVIAHPVERECLQKFGSKILYELQLVADAEISAKNSSPRASKYKQLLNRLWNKVQLGKAQGMWRGIAYLLADSPQTIVRAKATAKSIFSGGSSTPDPIRILDSHQIQQQVATFSLPNASLTNPPGQVDYETKYLSLLNSSELSAMIHLPTREVSGFFVQPQARFDVTPHPTTDKNGKELGKEKIIELGEIVNQGQKTGNQYKVSLDSLKRHAMVVGTTGSGKTNTIFNILRQLAAKDIPFLVIEPAKTEYRALLESEFGDRLQIFTLGNETISPFRINPFEIIPGVSVQTHIDYLKSVFNASFVMYAPMPQVLERCIHEIYEDKGWNLVTGKNDRGHHPNAYPTLSDLYRKVTEIVDQLGYEDNITMNIDAALKTRIGSLRIGGKGLMLDTKISFPITSLLDKPTILELDDIGDDDEKAFLIGLILMRLYEHYRSEGQQEDGSLKHVTIIEEAHRLLKATPQATDPEAANMAKKAVESFTNMLAEVRAYGEGFIVAEQIPSKLALDVIKNTNLKIAHRLIAEEDRKLVGGTMALNSEQEKWVGQSQVGEASVFSGVDDNPFRIKVPDKKFKGFASGLDNNRKVKELMQFLQQRVKTSKLNHYLSSNLPEYSSKAFELVHGSKFQLALYRFLLSISVEPQVFIDELQYAEQTARDIFLEINQTDKHLSQKAILLGLEIIFEKLGRRCRVSYEEIAALQNSLFFIINSTFEENDNQILSNNLSDFIERFVNTFITRNHPFVGCEYVCRNEGCIYRYLVEERVHKENIYILQKVLATSHIDEIWENTNQTLKSISINMLSDDVKKEKKTQATLCLAVQLSEKLPFFDTHKKQKLIRNIVSSFKENG